MANTPDRPRVRFSLRWKIILPYIFLALVFALVATLFVNKLVVQAEAVRFLRQLRDCGQQAVDEVVRIEDRLLEIERAIAFTEGVPEAVALGNSEDLRDRIISTVINRIVAIRNLAMASSKMMNRKKTMTPRFTVQKNDCLM